MWWLDDGPSTGTQPESKAVLQESESQRDAETQSLRSDLESLQALLAESETRRSDLEAAITQRDATREGQLAQSEQARESAEARAHELTAQLISLKEEAGRLKSHLETESKDREAANRELEQCRAAHAAELASLHAQIQELRQSLQRQLESSSAQLDKECESRVAAETEVRRMTDEYRQLSDATEKTRGEYHDSQRHCAEQTASLETQIAELRSQVESERASRIRVELEIQQVAEELTRQLADERQQWLLSQSQLTDLQVELARRQHELDATRSSAAETGARKTSELAEMQVVLAGQASELATRRDQIKQLEQQLQEAVLRNQGEQESRQRAEALAEPLTQEVALQRKRVEAFRGLAQREVAARRKLEAAIKRTGDTADGHPGTLAILANIEVNERIRRLTTELTATRNQELSVRQRAIQEIKRAQEEVRQLKDQLARERSAA